MLVSVGDTLLYLGDRDCAEMGSQSGLAADTLLQFLLGVAARITQVDERT